MNNAHKVSIRVRAFYHKNVAISHGNDPNENNTLIHAERYVALCHWCQPKSRAESRSFFILIANDMP